MEIDTLCFSSGGIQGLIFISALKYLIDNKYINLDNIKNYLGTSAGAIFSFLLIIGYTSDELILFFLNYDYKKLEPTIDLISIEENYGLDNGQQIIELLSEFCEKKLNVKDLTFLELYNITNKKFMINTTNFNTGKEVILNHELTPDLSVLKGIRMSISIPIIYTPVLYNDEYYVDGALSNSILIKYCNPKSTVGFFIDGQQYNNLKSFQDIIIGSLVILTNKTKIDDTYKVIKFKIDNTTFIPLNIEKEYIQQLFNIGVEYSEQFYMNELKKKINKIKSNIIKDTINNIIVKIEQNNI
jgi:predicted acylesterase/phospholipase RssA